MYRAFFKRLFDILISLTAIIVLSPVFIVMTIAGRIIMKGNPFFVQERLGYKERVFKLVKFRSMTEEKDENGEYLPDEKRLTKYGLFIRKTSIDEIPELFNILMGDMSLIGPRPLLTYYIPYYTKEERHRHDVRPGLTGLAQVYGRNFLTWEETFEYDLEYVNKVSLFFDISIIFMTVKILLKHNDVEDRSKVHEENGVLIYDDGKSKRRVHAPLDVERKDWVKNAK